VASPTFQAEGATVAVTTGAPSITIPTHQTDDILVVCATYWGPATVVDAAQIPTPTNYTLLGSQVGQPAAADRDGWTATFWRRAPSAGTTVTLTTGASWDSGADTCYGARAYVIRGCNITGNPFEFNATSGPHTTANQAFPALTVSGTERMAIQFGISMDNAAFAMTATGWTLGTEDDDATGTDCAFQTARKDNVSANTAADTSTNAAPAQGAYVFYGVVFLPVVTAAVTGTITSATTEADIVAGGKTIIITLTNDEWIAAGAGSFDLQRDEILQGLDSAQSETLGWNLIVRDTELVTAVVRTSNTVVTITLTAKATYNITAQETITVTVPGTAILLGDDVLATPTFTVSHTVTSVPYPRLERGIRGLERGIQTGEYS